MGFSFLLVCIIKKGIVSCFCQILCIKLPKCAEYQSTHMDPSSLKSLAPLNQLSPLTASISPFSCQTFLSLSETKFRS
ncbi:hypothetical protein KP509_39G019800 [Ceratopteris richardii]|uniref:Uncharacterized protein n=1 Tax=Ceratopteris richardii TaxID=49495 RepID=A0A8T2PZC4_CERRI|nr:hypothetical protein KP509_39G019800 [Ceratopteris richardii]